MRELISSLSWPAALVAVAGMICATVGWVATLDWARGALKDLREHRGHV